MIEGMNVSKIDELESQLTQLQRHVTEQDNEIYRLSRRLDQQNQVVSALKLRLESFASGRGGSESIPHEKPPHY